MLKKCDIGVKHVRLSLKNVVLQSIILAWVNICLSYESQQNKTEVKVTSQKSILSFFRFSQTCFMNTFISSLLA